MIGRMIFWWFTRLLFRFIKHTSGLEHAHYFWESEVKRHFGNARCVHCGAKLDEVRPRQDSSLSA